MTATITLAEAIDAMLTSRAATPYHRMAAIELLMYEDGDAPLSLDYLRERSSTHYREQETYSKAYITAVDSCPDEIYDELGVAFERSRNLSQAKMEIYLMASDMLDEWEH